MKPESENDPLVDALRADLPNDEQSARLRARLSALGIASAGALATSSAMAAGAAGKAVADVSLAAGALARFTALSFSAKVGVATVVCGSLVAVPAAILSSPTQPEPVAPAPTRAKQAAPRAAARAVPPATAARAGVVEPLNAAARAPDIETAVPEASPIAEPPTRTRARPSGPRLAVLDGPSAPARATATAAIDAQASPSVAFEADAPVPAPVATAAASEAPPAPASGTAENAPAIGAPAATTLTEEAVLMDRALSALRAGDRALALRLVLEHERRFPNGLLRREREKARSVLAR